VQLFLLFPAPFLLCCCCWSTSSAVGKPKRGCLQICEQSEGACKFASSRRVDLTHDATVFRVHTRKAKRKTQKNNSTIFRITKVITLLAECFRYRHTSPQGIGKYSLGLRWLSGPERVQHAPVYSAVCITTITCPTSAHHFPTRAHAQAQAAEATGASDRVCSLQ
jgi:hypothetical protein